MAEKQIHNPNGAYGYTDLQTQLYSIEGEFKAATAIAGAPQVVAIGTDGKIGEAATNSTATLTIGIAMRNAAINDTIGVVLLGIAENVPCDGAVARGDILKRSVTTTGSVAATATPALGENLGIAMNASASNTVDVWVCKSAALS